MAERILRLHNHGVVTDLTHLTAEDTITLEFSDPTDEDPIEWVNVHVRSSSTPALVETRSFDEAADNTPGPMTTERTMEPREANADEPESDEELIVMEEGDLILNVDDLSKKQLQEILRDKDLPTSGSKSDLIDRLNASALDDEPA